MKKYEIEKVVLTPLTKKLTMKFPPTVRTDIRAVAECITRLMFSFKTDHTDCPMDMIIPTFSLPKFISTVTFSKSVSKRQQLKGTESVMCIFNK